jgi:hypothetical protein
MDEYAIKWATIDLVAAAIADRHHCSQQSESFRQDLLETVPENRRPSVHHPLDSRSF